MAINDSPGDDNAWRIGALRHSLESSSHADAALLLPTGGPLPDDWHAPWLRAGWSIAAVDDCVEFPQAQSRPGAMSLIVSAWPRVGDTATTGAAKTEEMASQVHDSLAGLGIGGNTAPFPAARGGNGRTLRRGDFLAHLTAVMAMPGNESWVLLAIRVDQLPELASLGLSAMFELEEQVFARLLARLHSQDVSTIWMEFGFGILIRRDDWSQVEAFARQLCNHVAEEPFRMPEVDIGLTISVGMALVPANTPDGGHRWFAIAHAAQAIAYRHGGNQCEGVLTRAYEPMPPERVLIIREWLEEAKTGSNVVVEFQPVLPLGADTAPMYTLCAKLRDHRAPLGGVYRAEFRPLAVGTGALTMIDRLSLFSAFEALEQERARGRATELVVPIDLSTLDGVPWRWLEAELVRHGAISGGLVLELQASTALQAPEVVERIVRLRGLGVRISLHDRNGGLESTRTWSALPVDILRLPASALDAEPPPECFEKIALWKEQGRRLILDGVEGIGAISRLSEHHVDYLSGDGLAPIGPKLDFDFA